jgi:hypothetical protein
MVMKKTLMILLGLCLAGYFTTAVEGASRSALAQTVAAVNLGKQSGQPTKAHKGGKRAKRKHGKVKKAPSVKKKQIIHKRVRKS